MNLLFSFRLTKLIYNYEFTNSTRMLQIPDGCIPVFKTEQQENEYRCVLR